MAEKALKKSTETFKNWSKVVPRERAEYLFRSAELMQQRRHEFSALLILEAGKNYEEADGEVSEAIDFMNFYARAMVQLEDDTHYLKRIPGETNRLKYIPLGARLDVINFITGDSSEFGDFITGHRLTRFIDFTGSKDVGLRINEIAGRTAEGQKWIKRVNAEMGGKDGIVVDETADLDKVAQSIVSSGFTFQRQKCSAGLIVILQGL